MDLKNANPELLKHAYLMMKEAEQHEYKEEYISAIFKYQKAADILVKSGLQEEKLEEIYNRIDSLDQFFKVQMENATESDALQDIAFEWINAAKDLESQQRFQIAVESYSQAILLLKKAGWKLEHLREFQNEMERIKQEVLQKEKKESEVPDSKEQKVYIKSQMEDSELQQKVFAGISEKIKESIIVKPNIGGLEEFQRKQKELKDLQNRALGLIDEANNIIEQITPDYDKAIKIFVNARNLLTQVGWLTELKYIDGIIEGIKKEKKERENKAQMIDKLKEQKLKEQEGFRDDIRRQINIFETIKKQQQIALNKFREQSEKKQEIEKEAFQFINIAKKSNELKNYLESVEYYKKSIEKFEKIGWVDQISLIEAEIEKMYVFQDQKEKNLQLKGEMRSNEQKRMTLQEKSVESQREKKFQNLAEISSMIRVVVKKKEEEKVKDQLILEEEEKLFDKRKTEKSKQLIKKPLSLSLTDSIKEVVEKKGREISVKREEIEKELGDLSKMIKEAAENVKKQKKEKENVK
ncbi:MAG: hypothetical protein ACTSWY_09050 [Promethearchaeota archaeon]